MTHAIKKSEMYRFDKRIMLRWEAEYDRWAAYVGSLGYEHGGDYDCRLVVHAKTPDAALRALAPHLRLYGERGWADVALKAAAQVSKGHWDRTATYES